MDFTKPVVEQLVELDCANYLTSNFTDRGYVKGLKVYQCACGAHAFASAFDDKMDTWVRHQRMHPRLRQLIEKKQGAPERPPPAPVIMVDVDDAHLLLLRRWRVYSPSRPETYRVKLFAKSGPRAKVLARTIHPNADCISYLNGDGLNNRRHNLKPTNGTEIQRERRAREKTAKAKKGSRKVLAKAA